MTILLPRNFTVAGLPTVLRSCTASAKFAASLLCSEPFFDKHLLSERTSFAASEICRREVCPSRANLTERIETHRWAFVRRRGVPLAQIPEAGSWQNPMA